MGDRLRRENSRFDDLMEMSARKGPALTNGADPRKLRRSSRFAR